MPENTDAPNIATHPYMGLQEFRAWFTQFTGRTSLLSRKTVRRLQQEEGLPHISLGKRIVVFPTAEVLDWLQTRITHLESPLAPHPRPANLPDFVTVTVTPVRPRRAPTALEKMP